MRIEFSKEEWDQLQGGDGRGLEIGVMGFKADPTSTEDKPTQVFIEIYEGELRIHVWNGESEDAVSTFHIDSLDQSSHPIEAA